MRRTLRNSRQLRCSAVFSTVRLASPLASVSGLPGMVLALPPASLPRLLFSSLPGPAPSGNILMFPQMKHFRCFLPVGHAFIGSPWLSMLCNPSRRTPQDPCPAARFPAGKRSSGLSSLPASHAPSSHGHGSKGVISETLASFSEGGIGKIPRRWVIVHTSVSGTRHRSISAGHSVRLFGRFVCTLNT